MIRKFFCIALLSVLAVGTALGQSGKLNKFILQIGGQNQNAAYGSLLDLKERKVYNIADGSARQGDIDLLYGWGKTSKANLMTPTSAAVKLFGNPYRDRIAGAWETKNGGLMVVIKSSRKNRKLYKGLKTEGDIEKLYDETAKTVKEHSDYKLTKYGPSRRLAELEIGDLVLFRSVGRKFYAAGTVRNITEGFRGEIEIEFKVPE